MGTYFITTSKGNCASHATNRLLDQSLLKLYQQSIDFLEFERENPNLTNYELERPTEVVGTP